MFADRDFVIRYMNPQSLETLRTLEEHLPVPADQIVGRGVSQHSGACRVQVGHPALDADDDPDGAVLDEPLPALFASSQRLLRRPARCDVMNHRVE